MADEQLQRGPVEKRLVLQEALQRAGQSAPQACASGVVDTDNPPPSVYACELYLVCRYEHRRICLDVDERATENILIEQHLAGAAFEAPEAELLAGQTHGARPQLRHAVDGHEQLDSRTIFVVKSSIRAGRAIIAGVSKVSAALTKFNVPAARMAGRINGKVIRRATPASLDPKVLADSSSAGSIPRRAAAIIKKARGVRTRASTKIKPESP